jgi:membrane associated rhomboid family serine protease
MKGRVVTLTALTLLMLLVTGAGLLLPGLMRELALVPREPVALLGIVTMPLVHASWSHLWANLPPFLVLSTLVLVGSPRYYLMTTALIVVLGGIGLWLFGRAGFHVGASGLIFGYFGFLLARGFYDRKLGPVLLAVTTALLYGGMLWGVMPTAPGVSWDGHLAGLIAGVITSRLVLQTLRLK